MHAGFHTDGPSILAPPVVANTGSKEAISMRSTVDLDASRARFLNEKEVAAMASISTSWLQKLRMLGDGPKFYKLGKAVRYAEADVHQWLESQRAA